MNKNGRTEDGDDDIFVRRFALFDSLSGRDAKYYEDAHKPKLLRFAVRNYFEYCVWQIRLQYHTPILELKYRERTRESIEEGYKMDQTKVEFEVEYHVLVGSGGSAKGLYISSQRWWGAGGSERRPISTEKSCC